MEVRRIPRKVHISLPTIAHSQLKGLKLAVNAGKERQRAARSLTQPGVDLELSGHKYQDINDHNKRHTIYCQLVGGESVTGITRLHRWRSLKMDFLQEMIDAIMLH